MALKMVVEKLKLTTPDGKLKNAAAALFLHYTSQFPQFLLRMARFRGTNKNEFFDNQRAYGNFFTLLDAGMAFFFKHLSISGKIVGFTREEKLEVPDEALREALSFVWITFRRTAIQAYCPSTPTTPSTSKREDAKLRRLRTLLSTIGENGASLKVLMEAMQRKDRKGFVSTYITPNIETGYIAMLYPETPNHPMQSYYLTNKGREALNNL